MASRDKITAYIPQDLGDALRRVAAIKDRSVSDIVEDAIAQSFTHAGREAEHAALMTRLDRMQRRLGVIEHSCETLFELGAHSMRFQMSMAPDISEAERSIFNARGAERFSQVIEAIIERIGAGRSLWRNRFASKVAGASTPEPADPSELISRAAE